MRNCPRVNHPCEFYYYQDDSNGELAIDRCGYHEPDEEGNVFKGECCLEKLRDKIEESLHVTDQT